MKVLLAKPVHFSMVQVAAILARVNSCLWRMENSGQKKIICGGGIVDYYLLWGHMRRQFLREQSDQDKVHSPSC